MNIESLFVVSNPRSGSTQLVQFLRQVPECVCYGEIFKHEQVPREINVDMGASERAQHLYKTDMQQFWALLLEQQRENPKYVGAKIFPKHRTGDPIWDVIFSHQSRVIHLWRARLFDTYVSGLRAQQSGKWNVKQGVPVGPRFRESKVHFDSEKYLRYRKKKRCEFAMTIAALEQHPKTIQIEYSEISAPEALAGRLSEFFDVAVTLQPTLQKLATMPAIDYLENPADAVPYVDDLLNELEPSDRHRGGAQPE